jgi:hypothetical protein
MFGPVIAWAHGAGVWIQEVVAGFLTGLLIIWFLPSVLRGTGTAAVIGLLIIFLH